MRHLPLALLVVFGLVLAACSSPSLPPPVSSSPLPDCPDSPNCERVSKTYDVSPDTLFDASVRAMNALGPSDVTVQTGARTWSAVFRVGLVFKDDLDLAVTPGAPSSESDSSSNPTGTNTDAPADTMATEASSSTSSSSTSSSGTSSTATLHVRSASRTGYSDLGVNARRVERLLDALDRELSSSQ